MKNQAISLIIILVVTSLIIFSIAVLGKTKVLDISRNLENLNTLKFFDQFSEALLKSITYKMVEESVFEVANNSLGNYLWYNYPDCGYRPPTLDELNNHLSNTIKSKLSKTEEFIKLANMLKVFYPLEIYYKFDGIKIEFPFDENDLNSGAIDEGFPIIIRNVSIYIKTPFGETKKVYDFSLYINRTRLYYLYRTIRNWLNNSGYINLIENVEKKKGSYIYTCYYGYSILVTPDYLCKANAIKVCPGNTVNLTILRKPDNITTTICGSESQIEQQEQEIEEENKKTEENCNYIYQRKECEYDPNNCYITYSTSIAFKNKKMHTTAYKFAVSGSGGGTIGGGGGGGGTPPGPPQLCKNVRIVICNEEVIDKTKNIDEICNETFPAYPELKSGPPCPDGNFIECPSKKQIEDILISIKDELNNTLNSLFGKFDKNVKCVVDLQYYINCEPILTYKKVKSCSCGIAGKTETTIIATYFIRCTDSKYYSFIENSLKNLELYFQLGIKGKTNCMSSLPSSWDEECCNIYTVNEQKICGKEENGEYVLCQLSQYDLSKIYSTISAICLS